MLTTDAVLIDIDQGVAHVRLNRPQKRHAVDGEIIDGLLQVQASLAQAGDVSCVVLSGEGKAFCAGLNIALGADIRVVAPDARLGFVEITYGLLPDMSATQSLIHLVGLDRMKELVFTGRRFSGVEARAYGLATELSEDPVASALAMARTIVSRNPGAIRAAKSLFNEAAMAGAKSGLVAESNLSRQLMGTPDQLEAVMATLEGRAPNYGST